VSPGITDGRPEGWTADKAIEFIAAHLIPSKETISFADAFTFGQWSEIQKWWPQFQRFIDEGLG
jgi:hypothetical protein